ncbi:MAG: SNF2 family helicase [Anaerolineales bacterium]|nr:SNF2 family helicase [Anaerolineales bacterium]
MNLLSHFGIPLFGWQEEWILHPLEVYPDAVTLQALLSEDRDAYTLGVGLKLKDKTYTLSGRNLKIFPGSSPMWALAGQTLVQIANPHVTSLLSFFPLQIPKEAGEFFRKTYFNRLCRYLPVVGETVRWEVVQSQPVPRLYLVKKDDTSIEAELRFGYREHEFLSCGTRSVYDEILDISGQWGGIKVLRDAAAERRWHDLLTDPRYGLKRAGVDRPGIFQIRARTHPLDFLMKCIPELTAAGFEIYGEQDIMKINRHKPLISLNISSGIDWFDIHAVVQYGDQQVDFREIRRALRRGERYIKLADGSVGQIPEEWLEKYKHLFNLAEETANGLRINDLQISLLDELLAEAETKNIAPEFHARLERLQSFDRIAEQSLPQGFSGELRHYQKAGYDWLHFLYEYGFGGILADDMGLGKTVQTLAFLQSLKERGQLSRPVLLVVSKSLLVNWQREAQRFTPGLRVLQFKGQARKKDPAHFENYDIVTTTYGTMLRDIKFLQKYRFSYVILDESQAIKNPLSQSSKAARLLQSEHRLCLTGTPVENNVYELWSQFAFLNPGLLGGLEYFKSGFAAAIERRDEGAQPTIQTLRKLIYPFLLRRTKEQVAPELPPRTERIIYADLEPAQRKLYQQIRDYYRGLLLGMLNEGSDINDIRFKILEGLLRMRQVCVHPQLVEPGYHGESAKFEILLEILETLRAEGHKALIFSQFVQTLGLLRKEMDARHMAYAYLDGQTQNRQEQVDRFQTDPDVPFFLISLKAGGVGLNLTAADYVLHIDPWWNPAVEMQAADRAHRIGQDKPVFIYKFIARDTVEEKILQLQERKRDLVEQLISAEGSFFKSLTREDLQVLFS